MLFILLIKSRWNRAPFTCEGMGSVIVNRNQSGWRVSLDTPGCIDAADGGSIQLGTGVIAQGSTFTFGVHALTIRLLATCSPNHCPPHIFACGLGHIAVALVIHDTVTTPVSSFFRARIVGMDDAAQERKQNCPSPQPAHHPLSTDS
mmetsp:Transcript_45180/g.70831  ORF Transcript_45180/g.70831 Transcript_45180/m.70831 type:complete len:147 (+) Transcript_45180:183-623(+)